jgi:hypothetical protein
MIEQRLENMYQKVMELEKFAEAKNSILLTFIGVILVLLYDIFGLKFYGSLYILLGLPVFIALILTMISFLPYRDRKGNKDHKKVAYQDQDNIMSISLLSTIHYSDINLLNAIGNDPNHKYDQYQYQLLNSMLFNARITQRKFILFRYAISTLFVIPLCIALIKKIFED